MVDTLAEEAAGAVDGPEVMVEEAGGEQFRNGAPRSLRNPAPMRNRNRAPNSSRNQRRSPSESADTTLGEATVGARRGAYLTR